MWPRSWSRAGRAASSAARASSSRRSRRTLERGGAVGADRAQLLAAGVGELDEHGAGVGGVAGLAHEAVLREPGHERGHRRLGHELGGGQVGDPHRPVVVEPAQGQQCAHAAAAMGLGTQDVRDERDAALQLGRQIFDSHTI